MNQPTAYTTPLLAVYYPPQSGTISSAGLLGSVDGDKDGAKMEWWKPIEPNTTDWLPGKQQLPGCWSIETWTASHNHK